MSLPQVIWEAAFGVAPLTRPTTQWVDISNYFRSGTMKRGRVRELDAFTAGAADIKLKNLDRRFDPTNTASPYAPNVVPGVRLRCRAVWNSVSYPIWTGFAEGWPPVWPGNAEAGVNIKATDHFGMLLGEKRLNSNRYASTVAGLTPKAYYELADAFGATTAADSSGNGYTGQVMGTVDFGVKGPLLQVVDTACSFGDGLGGCTGYVSVPVSMAATLTGNFAIAFWFQIPSGTWDGNLHYLYHQWVSPTSSMGIYVTAGGQMAGKTGSQTFLANGPVVTDGEWHFVVVTATTSGSLDGFSGIETGFYLDDVALDYAAGSTNSAPSVAVIGAQCNNTSGAPAANWPGNISDVVMLTSVMTASQRQSLYDLGPQLWTGQTSGQRCTTILDVLGVDAADRSIETGVSTLGAESRTLATTDAISYLQRLQETESAQFFVSGDGKITFYDRSHNARSPYNTSQATFSDVDPSTGLLPGGALPYVPNGAQFNYDIVEVDSEIQVTRYGGVTQVATDSRGAGNPPYGPHTLTRTDQLFASDSDALDAANWLLVKRMDPHLRCDTLVLDPRLNDALWPQVLGREIGDVITVMKHPPGGGAAISGVFRIEGIQHDLIRQPGGPRQWKTTWNLSAADTDSYFIVETPTGYLDTNRLGY